MTPAIIKIKIITAPTSKAAGGIFFILSIMLIRVRYTENI
jgi:hypothetical protein